MVATKTVTGQSPSIGRGNLLTVRLMDRGFMPKTKEADVLSGNNTHLLEFTPEVLRDLARNDAAPWDYRKAAVEVLINKKHPYFKHEDLRELVHELNVEISDIVFEHPAISGPGPRRRRSLPCAPPSRRRG